MSRRIPVVLLALYALLSAESAFAQAQSADEKAVRARRDAFLKAINARKPDEVATFLSDSLVILAQGQTISGKQAKEAMKALTTIPAGVTVKSTIDKVELKGDTAVLTITDNIYQKGADGKEKLAQSGVSKETWKKSGKTWLLIKNDNT